MWTILVLMAIGAIVSIVAIWHMLDVDPPEVLTQSTLDIAHQIANEDTIPIPDAVIRAARER